MTLRRYWFEFEISPHDWSWPTSVLKAGCGATGVDQADCLNLIQERIMKGNPLPPARRIVEDVDVSTLDAKHVLPNMGFVTERGIWFPAGYDR